MQRARFLRALCCTVSLLSSVAPACAEDAGEATRLSVEPRAIPAETPAEATRESDTREAMCLMIEVGRESLEPAARILRPRDLAGEPLPLRRDRAGDAQRPARAGDCAVHARHRERARPARSLQSRAGAAEIGGVSGRAARPVRQSGTGGRRLQCRPAPGSGVARRHRCDAAGDAQLRSRHHGLHRRGLGEGAEGRQDTGADTDVELSRLDGAAEAGAQSLRHRTRRAASRSVPPKCGACNSPPASAATRRSRCTPAP